MSINEPVVSLDWLCANIRDPELKSSEDAFADSISALAIKNKKTIGLYDGEGNFCVARVWW
uniref:Uncharacterized protein n=1 Tax=Solanum lycopersicum TaxID=4081 RepID=K4AV24_SOLLC